MSKKGLVKRRSKNSSIHQRLSLATMQTRQNSSRFYTFTLASRIGLKRRQLHPA